MTDIDLLRRAAALMRERAQAAESAGWQQYETDVLWNPESRSDPEWHAGAWHSASWHPAVALAVADWLDIISAHWAESEVWESATLVASTYLGEAE